MENFNTLPVILGLSFLVALILAGVIMIIVKRINKKNETNKFIGSDNFPRL